MLIDVVVGERPRDHLCRSLCCKTDSHMADISLGILGLQNDNASRRKPCSRRRLLPCQRGVRGQQLGGVQKESNLVAKYSVLPSVSVLKDQITRLSAVISGIMALDFSEGCCTSKASRRKLAM